MFATVLSSLVLAAATPDPAVQAAHIASVLDPDRPFEARHATCLELIAEDPDTALEAALAWTGQGGGFRARHCGAMALFALDHPGEAGARLDAVVADFGDRPDPKLDALRANYSVEAAQAWLQADEPRRAYDAATRALDIAPNDTQARIVRARVYFALERFADAETDLTSALAFAPDHAEALRFRADARLKQGKLAAALEDAEASLALEPSVDTMLVRGHIRQAQTKEAKAKEAQDKKAQNKVAPDDGPGTP